MKFKSSVPGIIGEIADHGDVDTDTVQEPLIHSPKSRAGKLPNTDGEGRMEMPQKKRCPWCKLTEGDSSPRPGKDAHSASELTEDEAASAGRATRDRFLTRK